jgi:rRNA maturation endonuclease Nob1
MLYLIDAGVILNNEQFSFDEKHQYLTINEVMDEFKDFRSKTLADSALKQGQLSLIEPKPEFVQAAQEFMASIGLVLSKTDAHLLAAALQLQAEDKEFEVLTDDYSLQNALQLKKIAFKGILMGEIEKPKTFKKTSQKTAENG